MLLLLDATQLLTTCLFFFFCLFVCLLIFRCPSGQVLVLDDSTSLQRCAPSPCQPSICRNGGTCVAQSAKSYQCRCAEGFRGQWCEVGRAKALRLAALSPSSILAISMCLLVFFGE